ncbi:MAG: DUF1963 domain-containing protein [Lachnospiraceae bacterium]|nr:DUF1963 domain-containing protein [Lachnospiraceae bacterium]MCI9401213.1 DUF1963 domain-containing protein [Lachnospiraceae bacterium]
MTHQFDLFFINSKALANRDFRKVLYYWDTI